MRSGTAPVPTVINSRNYAWETDDSTLTMQYYFNNHNAPYCYVHMVGEISNDKDESERLKH
jgi:hypothetical protein